MARSRKTTDDATGADRTITSTDNNPPEAISQPSAGLPTAAEIPAVHKEAVDALVAEHLEKYMMCTRVPEVIEDKDVYDRVTTLGGLVKKASTAIDKVRSAAKKPYLDGGAAVDRAFSLTVEIVDPEGAEEDAEGQKAEPKKVEIDLAKELKDAHARLKARLSDYDTREYQAAQAKQEEDNARIAEAAQKDGILFDVSAMSNVQVHSSRSGHGGTAIKQVEHVFEVTDASLVPAAFCSPDPEKIKAAIAAGVREIPGVHIQAKVNTHMR